MTPDRARRNQAKAMMVRVKLYAGKRAEPPDIAETLAALEQIPADQAAVLRAYFLQPGFVDGKARAMGIRKPAFYWLLGASLETLHVVIGLLRAKRKDA